MSGLSPYALSLRQEVLLEKGAAVLGDFFRRLRLRPSGESGDPLRLLQRLTWEAKQDILQADTEARLDRIEGRLDLARDFLDALGETEAAPSSGAPEDFTPGDVEDAVLAERERITERYFPGERPRAYLLAGQPGSGKTLLSAMLLPMLENNAVLLNNDEYRRYHPNYLRLYREFGPASVPMTAKFCGAVTEALIAALSDLRLDLIIEGTGRTAEVPRRTAELLTEKGYRVRMAVMAVRPEISLVSTLLRCYAMSEGGTPPRTTPLEAHDRAAAALPGNLDALSALPCISGMGIWTREREELYRSETAGETPSEALRRFRARPWTPEEIRGTEADLRLLREKEARLHLGLEEAIGEAQRRFRRAAATAGA